MLGAWSKFSPATARDISIPYSNNSIFIQIRAHRINVIRQLRCRRQLMRGRGQIRIRKFDMPGTKESPLGHIYMCVLVDIVSVPPIRPNTQSGQLTLPPFLFGQASVLFFASSVCKQICRRGPSSLPSLLSLSLLGQEITLPPPRLALPFTIILLWNG